MHLKLSRFLLFLLALVLTLPASIASDTSGKLVIAYIYNLAMFVSWPSDVLSPEDDINICFYGDFNDLASQAKVLTKKKVKTHSINTKHVPRGKDLSACQIAYISESEKIYFRPLLAKLSAYSILTISSTDSFIRENGMVQFVYSNDKLRFDINKTATQQSKLSISSQVLRLAREVVE